MSEVLAEPVPPTMPSVEPDSMRRLISDSAFSSAVAEYLKDTSSKMTEPSATSVTPFSGEVNDGSWLRTLAIRCADSAAMVVMTKMKASMSICDRIWMP